MAHPIYYTLMAHPICFECDGPLVLREIARDDKGWTVAWVCVKCGKGEA